MLSVTTVVNECPGLECGDFKRYLPRSLERTPLDRGFEIMTHRDTLTHIFIFDRELAQSRSSMPDIVPTKAFREFESLYIRRTNRTVGTLLTL